MLKELWQQIIIEWRKTSLYRDNGWPEMKYEITCLVHPQTFCDLMREQDDFIALRPRGHQIAHWSHFVWRNVAFTPSEAHVRQDQAIAIATAVNGHGVPLWAVSVPLPVT